MQRDGRNRIRSIHAGCCCFTTSRDVGEAIRFAFADGRLRFAGGRRTQRCRDASAQVADAVGDASPGYPDIVGVTARAEGAQLSLSLRLAGDLPASSVSVGTVRYAFDLDTDGDGQTDRVATLEMVPEGGYRPVLTDVAAGGRVSGPAYPGTAGLDGADVNLTVRLGALGCPASVAIRASVQRVHGGTITRDDAPQPGAAPLTVKTAC